MKRASRVARLSKFGTKHLEAGLEAGLGLWKLEPNNILMVFLYIYIYLFTYLFILVFKYIYIFQRRGPILVLKRQEKADAQTWAFSSI